MEPPAEPVKKRGRPVSQNVLPRKRAKKNPYLDLEAEDEDEDLDAEGETDDKEDVFAMELSDLQEDKEGVSHIYPFIVKTLNQSNHFLANIIYPANPAPQSFKSSRFFPSISPELY